MPVRSEVQVTAYPFMAFSPSSTRVYLAVWVICGRAPRLCSPSLFCAFGPDSEGERPSWHGPRSVPFAPAGGSLGPPALSGVEPPRRATLPPYRRASLAQSPVDVRSRERLAPVFRFVWRIGFGLLFFVRRGPASCAAVAAVSACLRAIAARHFAGWTLRSARN